MPRVYKKKTPEEGGRAWYDPRTLTNAIEAIRMGKMNQKTAAAFYGVPRSSLIRKMNGASKPGVSTGGRRLEFSEQEEADLVKYLKIISVCGEGLTKTETRNLVQEYVRKYNIKTRFRDGRPGYDWYINFMKRHPDISRKRYEQYSTERSKDVEPFQVYKFYEDLQKLYNQSHYFKDDGKLIYSFDECEFLYHTKGEKVFPSVPVTENTLVLACGSASGQQLTPFILFKGKFVQAPWVTAENLIPLESGSEFTEHNIFDVWFNRVFLNQIASLTDRLHKPVTLIFNGSKSHTKDALTLNIFEQCVQHKINLVRLPHSLVWELQPLQKFCFKEMKSAWNNWKSEQDLNDTLSQITFIRCLDEIWNNNVTGENLVLGFEKSGIFPVNQKLFPRQLFRPGALWRYEAHVTENKPETVFVVIDNEEVQKPIISNEIKLELKEKDLSESQSSPLKPKGKGDAKSVDEQSSDPDSVRPFVPEENMEKHKKQNTFKKPIEKRRVSNKFGKIMLMNEIIRQRAMFTKSRAKGNACKPKWQSSGEACMKASSSSDKEESSFQSSLTPSTSLASKNRDDERCSLLPDEISECGAEVLSSGFDPLDLELSQPSKTDYYSPSSSPTAYSTSLPTCLSSSKNFFNQVDAVKNETEAGTSFLSNPSQSPVVLLNDAYTKFFLSMADTVRDLPPDLQIIAKRNVLHEVTECELTALNRLNASKN